MSSYFMKDLLLVAFLCLLHSMTLSAQKPISEEKKERFEKHSVSEFAKCEGFDADITLDERIDLTKQLLKEAPFVFEGQVLSLELKIVGDKIFKFNKIEVLSIFKGEFIKDTIVITSKASANYYIYEGKIRYNDNLTICSTCNAFRIQQHKGRHIYTCKLDENVEQAIVGDYMYLDFFKKRNYTYLTSKSSKERGEAKAIWHGFYALFFWDRAEMLAFLSQVDGLEYKRVN